MKKYLLLSFGLIASCGQIAQYAKNCNRPYLSNQKVYPSKKASDSIRIFSYNMRAPFFEIDQKTGHDWHDRAKKIAAQINHYQPSIIAAQEIMFYRNKQWDQVADLLRLSKGYQFIGYKIYQETEGVDEEVIGFFLKKKDFEVQQSGRFWLTKTPHIYKRQPDWDAARPCLVTWLHLKYVPTNKEFYIATTHADSKGPVARLKSMGIIEREMRKIAGQSPAIILGDFNTMMDMEPTGQQAYQAFLEPDYFTDVRDVSHQKHIGPDGTFIGFSHSAWMPKEGQEPNRFDHIFISKGIDVLREGVINDRVQNGIVYPQAGVKKYKELLNYETTKPSDHAIVAADILIG